MITLFNFSYIMIKHIFIPLRDKFVGFTVVPKYSVVVSSLTVLLPLVSREVFDPSVEVVISCFVDKLFGDSVVIFREPGKLSVDVILLGVDEPSVKAVVKFCDKEKL